MYIDYCLCFFKFKGGFLSGKVISGDFPEGAQMSLNFLGDVFLSWGFVHNFNLRGQVERVELVTEENKKKLLSAAGWGLVGGVLAGPLGLIPGLVFGGRTKEICFACYLKDGRKFLAVSDNSIYQKIYSYVFI